jgi:hypothetical protein
VQCTDFRRFRAMAARNLAQAKAWHLFSARHTARKALDFGYLVQCPPRGSRTQPGVSTRETPALSDAPSQGATPLRPREKHPARPGWRC